MSIDEFSDAEEQARRRRRRFLLSGIGLLSAFPAAGLVLSAIGKLQDASDRTK